ncbi:MAG: substrate-binding domain-containing protein [Clostridiales bacterium]|nr:substrate-binding domain-containing protein [Clostridiales bacterium]
MANNEISKHLALSQWIKDNIDNGTFAIGDKIPSENDLAQQFGYSRQTVRQAIGTLVAEGILIRKQGSGTYVSSLAERKPTEKTMRIGVITTYLDDYIFPGIIHGMERVFMKEGYTLSLGITYNKPSNEEKCLQQMLQSGVDGFIIEATKSALPNPNEYLYKEIKERQIPTVFINGYYSHSNYSYVVMDDVKAGSKLAKILINKGHDKIGGFFKSDDIQGHKRYEGVLKTTKKNGITLNEDAIFWYTTEDFKYLFGGNSDDIILNRLQGITAVVCYNDQVAEAFIKLLNRKSLSVPKDISVVSFDNSFLAKHVVYNLTSVVYPAKAIGEKAATLLLKNIKNPYKIQKIKLEPVVKIRDSVKDINIHDKQISN